MSDEFIIDISKPAKDFQEHLDLFGNNRIIFSGIFGIGKTFFLDKFFKENHERYNIIHLYPVNYSVSRNKDIFELVKYDIFYELLGKEIDFEEIDYSFFHNLPILINENFKEVIIPFLKLIPEIGKNLSTIYESLDTLGKKYKRLKTVTKVKDKDSALSFLKELELRTGSIYENDFYTELIGKMLLQLTESGDEDKKENILIIDDLDRVEPTHIFRLLNVFAAHFDIHDEKENKFGFDKVIFVCDIDNIRKLYSNLFGANIDFSGYIDKFYSREVYKFDNSEIVKSSIDKIINSINIEERYSHVSGFKSEETRIKNIIIWILTALVKAKAINLRTLLKLYDKRNPFKPYDISLGVNNIANWHVEIIVIFDFLRSLFGNGKNVIKAFKKSQKFEMQSHFKRGYYESRHKYIVGELLFILDIENHEFEEDKIFQYKSLDLGITYEYQLERPSSDFREIVSAKLHKAYLSNTEQPVLNLRPIGLLVETAKKLERLNLLN